MWKQTRLLGAAIVVATVLAAVGMGQSRALADEARLTVTPAIQRVGASGESGAKVQLVQWGRPYGYRYGGFYRPFYGGPYYAPYAPYYVPYGTPYPTPYATPYPTPYATPYYGYPAYGYGYSYPAYGYGYPVYGGVGIRTGRVGIGIW